MLEEVRILKTFIGYALHMASQIDGKGIYAQQVSCYLNVGKPAGDVKSVKKYIRAVIHTPENKSSKLLNTITIDGSTVVFDWYREATISKIKLNEYEDPQLCRSKMYMMQILKYSIFLFFLVSVVSETIPHASLPLLVLVYNRA